MTDAPLRVIDAGLPLAFTVDALTAYHGPGFPGGVAHGFKAMQRALPLLAEDGVPERRSIRIETAFRGPGARDAFELVTRAVTEDRYLVTDALVRADRGATLERYVFRFIAPGRTVTVQIRDGLVRDAFVALSRKPDRSAEEEVALTEMKREMANRLLALPAADVYDVDPVG